jgi:hypothetical protein
MRALYVFAELPGLLSSRYDPWTAIERKVRVYYGFFIWPFSLLIAPCAYAMWRSEMRPVLLSLALLSANMVAQIWRPQPHYAAPVAGAALLALLFSVRHFRNSYSDSVIWGSRALAIVLGIWMISPVAEVLRDPFTIIPNFSKAEEASINSASLPLQFRRAAIQAELDRRSGKQLVIVHYPYGYVPWEEWVYNDADIDHAHIVWARDMGYLKNRELLNYYSDRQAWYTDRGDPVLFLLPYDQVMAPLKMAFDGAAPEKNSPQVAGAGEHAGPIVEKPDSPSLTEIAAPRTE